VRERQSVERKNLNRRLYARSLTRCLSHTRRPKQNWQQQKKNNNFPVKGNNNKKKGITYICMYECVLMYAMKKRKRQHKGDCNTKIALKAWSKTTTMSKSLTAKKENKRTQQG